MKLSAKTTVVAEPLEKIDLQLFADGDGGAPVVGGSPGIDTSGQTSSIIPGDGYASGGPEPPVNAFGLLPVHDALAVGRI